MKYQRRDLEHLRKDDLLRIVLSNFSLWPSEERWDPDPTARNAKPTTSTLKRVIMNHGFTMASPFDTNHVPFLMTCMKGNAAKDESEDAEKSGHADGIADGADGEGADGEGADGEGADGVAKGADGVTEGRVIIKQESGTSTVSL